MAYGKKSFREKFNEKAKSLGRKIVALGVVAGAVAAPAWYHYGTIEQKEVKIIAVEKQWMGNEKLTDEESAKLYASYSYEQNYGSGSNSRSGSGSGSRHNSSDEFGPYPNDDREYDDPSSSFFGFGFGRMLSSWYTPPRPPEVVIHPIYEYTIITSAGAFDNDASAWLHLKGEGRTKEVQGQLAEGEIYRIRYYGVRIPSPLGGEDLWKPNILSVKPLTEEELLKRAQEKARIEQIRQSQQQQPEQIPPTTAPQQAVQQVAPPATQAGALSGEVVTYPVTVGSYSVQLTVPAEAVGKVTVNTVKPVVAPVAPKPGI